VCLFVISLHKIYRYWLYYFFFCPKDSSQPGALDIITPKIDQALEYFKQRGIVTSSETSSMCQSEPELDKSLPRGKTVSILLSYPY
jgi:hypothetical protein